MVPITARSWARLTAALAASAVALLAGCSGGGSSAATVAPAATSGVRDLTSYDAFVLGSVENNPAAADVYGIKFDPFTVDRITSGKRVSSLGADGKHVMVAAADEDIDKLAEVAGSGELLPVSGLGRPFAYSPTLRDGVMYYADAQGDKAKGPNRFFAWDFEKRTNKLLFASKDDLGAPTPLADGRLVLDEADDNGNDKVVIRTKKGKLTSFPIGGDASNGPVGADWLAATLVGVGDKFGDKPEALVFLNLKTGKTKRVSGLEAICWSPDGTRL
ncbi:MAG TPA: hypothetical protein VGL04_06455, partial [Sporichthyaceae bacterium]